MAYDVLAESVRLIERGCTDTHATLSRRRRFLPITVDVDGDVAMTQFLFRVHGGADMMIHLLHRTAGVWRSLGGGGGSSAPDVLLHPPSYDSVGGFGRAYDGAMVSLNADRIFPWGARYVYGVSLEVAEQVSSVVVGGTRTIPVPWHRRVGIVWSGRRPPMVQLRNSDGATLASFALPDSRCP